MSSQGIDADTGVLADALAALDAAKDRDAIVQLTAGEARAVLNHIAELVRRYDQAEYDRAQEDNDRYFAEREAGERAP